MNKSICKNCGKSFSHKRQGLSICSKQCKTENKAILNRNQYQNMLKSNLCFGGCGKRLITRKIRCDACGTNITKLLNVKNKGNVLIVYKVLCLCGRLSLSEPPIESS